jgi:hypothetical protein
MASWLSSWFGGSSAPAAAGEEPRSTKRSYSQTAEETWRPLYAPGSNPKMKASPQPGLPAAMHGLADRP